MDRRMIGSLKLLSAQKLSRWHWTTSAKYVPKSTAQNLGKKHRKCVTFVTFGPALNPHFIALMRGGESFIKG
jgi:hypothetical protein